MKGITGSQQMAAWLQSEYENRAIEQGRMARARLELTLSLDAMISPQRRSDMLMFSPLSDVRVEPRVLNFRVIHRAADTYTYLIGDPALLHKSCRRDDLSSIRRLFGCHILKLKLCSRLSTVHPGCKSISLPSCPSQVISFAWPCPRRLPVTLTKRYPS
jgi:hypothetical protein